MTIFLNIIKAVFYCILFTVTFYVLSKLGVTPFFSIAILLGAIAAIANSKRSFPDIWQSDDVYAIIFTSVNSDGQVGHQFLFSKTREEAQKILIDEVNGHIKQLHKPIGCENGFGYVKFKDENGNIYTLQISKQSMYRSKSIA